MSSMRARKFETIAAGAIALCCLALAIHTNRPAADVPVDTADTAAPITQVADVAVRPRIEVVFVLDTTGSMSGLIDGAKQKIWAIANRLASGEPRPELRIGLVAYRDRGDDYVTRKTDFTGDLDTVYADLLALQAQGGGDFPEHVGQGLSDAIDGMQWSSGDRVLRLVFLVGDAPPHDDYQDGPGTGELTARARAKGIVINTVQCGDNHDTALAWRRIAAAAGGDYTSIAQDGGVVAVATPFDTQLWELNNQLTRTVLTYGTAEQQRNSHVKLGNRASMSVSAAAEAASYSAKASRMNEEDLLGALEGGKALADIPREHLPADMQAMSQEAQAAHVAGVRAKRDALNAEIREVSAKRDAFLRDAESAAGVDRGFDGKVLDSLRKQASAIGVAY
jgi:hypothetical protein